MTSQKSAPKLIPILYTVGGRHFQSFDIFDQHRALQVNHYVYAKQVPLGDHIEHIKLQRKSTTLQPAVSSELPVQIQIQISYYPLFSGLFRDNWQHWLGNFARLLKVQFTSNEGMTNDAPIHECESEIDHYTRQYPTLYEECVGSLTSHRFITCARACEMGPTVYRPYPRRLESLTVCRCYYKGSTFSSVI